MTETKLKPCPFCGKMAFWDSDFSGIYCRCGAEFAFFENDKEAAKRWNSRPIEDAKDEEIKRLRKALEDIKEMANDMAASGASIYDLISIRNICCDALEGWKE